MLPFLAELEVPMSKLLSLATALVLACAPALAENEDGEANAPALPQQDGAQPNAAAQTAPSARYAFQQVKDGFLRLDTQTGAVAFCGPRAVGWACQAVPEERTALDQEIARLQGEVASLKKELTAAKSPSKNDEVRLKLPSREEMEQARAFVEDAWRRFVDMVSTFVGYKPDVDFLKDNPTIP